MLAAKYSSVSSLAFLRHLFAGRLSVSRYLAFQGSVWEVFIILINISMCQILQNILQETTNEYEYEVPLERRKQQVTIQLHQY